MTTSPTPTVASVEAGAAVARVAPPFADQTFDHFQQWVNRASSWLTCHPEYNNTEHGETKGWRGKHFTTLCFDSFGRRCRNGGDFQRAHDEGAFPVWWIWPDQIVEAITKERTPDGAERVHTGPLSAASAAPEQNGGAA